MPTIYERMSLEGRYALVTGATGALGSVISETLAELKSNLILVDCPGSDFERLVHSIDKKWNINVKYKPVDLEIKEDRDELLKWIMNDYNELNILINNAAFVGTSELQGWAVPFDQQTTETWSRALEVNLTAVFDLCKGLAPLLKNSKCASIVNIASIYGQCAPDWSLYEGTSMGNPAAYAASKGGIIQLTRWLSTTLAPKIRVNSISPGGIFRNQPRKFLDRYEERTPLGRMAKEEDFIGIITYLSSDLSEYVTGQNILIDGGWSVW